MFNRGNRAGLYLTISIHLGLLIVFLSYQIGFQLQQEASFMLDFSRLEEAERVAQRAQLRSEIAQELDALLSGNATAIPRNVAVDASERGQQLRDDRHRNPAQVYDEHQALQAKLDASRRAAQALQGSDQVAPISTNEQPRQAETYKGPSVISWKLEGRRAINLPIPVYKCLGGGDVTVMIAVDQKGYVIAASVVTDFSSSDACLTEYAIRAAKQSRFSRNDNAPVRQQGEIVYRFIAQ
jgi:hypothetical protein